jgi:hypothetical protein
VIFTTENSPASIIIDGGRRTVDLIGNSTGSSLITVGKGVTLTLRNITLKGLKKGDSDGADTSDNNVALVAVFDGKLIMDNGAKVQDNVNNSGSGGGVLVISGTFEMKGDAEISHNTVNGDVPNGGGVAIAGGKFEMKGGTISGNTATGNGGGVFVGGGVFNKTGGIIYGSGAGGNSNTAEGGGHAVYGPGAIFHNSTWE